MGRAGGEKPNPAGLWPDLFEAMLECWVRDEEYWPKERSFQMFQTWFEVQLSSIIEDLHPDEPLGYVE